MSRKTQQGSDPGPDLLSALKCQLMMWTSVSQSEGQVTWMPEHKPSKTVAGSLLGFRFSEFGLGGTMFKDRDHVPGSRHTLGPMELLVLFLNQPWDFKTTPDSFSDPLLEWRFYFIHFTGTPESLSERGAFQKFHLEIQGTFKMERKF